MHTHHACCINSPLLVTKLWISDNDQNIWTSIHIYVCPSDAKLLQHGVGIILLTEFVPQQCWCADRASLGFRPEWSSQLRALPLILRNICMHYHCSIYQMVVYKSSLGNTSCPLTAVISDTQELSSPEVRYERLPTRNLHSARPVARSQNQSVQPSQTPPSGVCCRLEMAKLFPHMKYIELKFNKSIYT